MSEERRPHRRAGITDEENREQQREYNRRYHETERGRAAVRRWSANRARDYQKQGAHKRVARAIKSGRLAQEPCFCGDPRSMAHHYLGYAIEHRLDVVWLCYVHHAEAHRKMAER